jgi:hypothetical protein
VRSGGAINSAADSGGEVQSVIDNIGLPYSGINLSYSNSAPVGTSDADVLVTCPRITIPRTTTFTSFA